MKKTRQTLWLKGSLKILIIYFSTLRNNVYIFTPILLKLVQMVCIIVRINLYKIKKIHQILLEKGPFKILYFFFEPAIKPTVLSNSFETDPDLFYHHRHQPSLRKHAYSNILIISPPKTENFQIKKIWYFSYFCSKHRLWVLVKTASSRRF